MASNEAYTEVSTCFSGFCIANAGFNRRGQRLEANNGIPQILLNPRRFKFDARNPLRRLVLCRIIDEDDVLVDSNNDQSTTCFAEAEADECSE